MAAGTSQGLTQLLHDWRGGDARAFDRLISLVHAELLRAARRCLRHERRNHTLETAELVNETYLRLVRSSHVQWRDRAHFFALAATLMRRVLVDHARKRQSQKREGTYIRVTLDESIPAAEQVVDVVALDEALGRLAVHGPLKAQLVELRFFGGLNVDEIAVALAISPDKVKREWRTARLWLRRALGEGADGPGALESD